MSDTPSTCPRCGAPGHRSDRTGRMLYDIQERKIQTLTNERDALLVRIASLEADAAAFATTSAQELIDSAQAAAFSAQNITLRTMDKLRAAEYRIASLEANQCEETPTAWMSKGVCSAPVFEPTIYNRDQMTIPLYKKATR